MNVDRLFALRDGHLGLIFLPKPQVTIHCKQFVPRQLVMGMVNGREEKGLVREFRLCAYTAGNQSLEVNTEPLRYFELVSQNLISDTTM